MKSQTTLMGMATAVAVVGLLGSASAEAAEPTAPPHVPEVTFNISGNVADTPEGVTLKNAIKQKVDWYWTHGSCPADADRICTPDQGCSDGQVCAAGYDAWATCPEDAGPVSMPSGQEGPCYCWEDGSSSCQYDSECLNNDEICVDGECRSSEFDWGSCDALRFGLTVFDDKQCQSNGQFTHQLVDEREEGQPVEDAVDGLTSGQRPYCRDQNWRPTDQALREFQLEDKFPGGTDAPTSKQRRWWERPHVNFLFIDDLPQTSSSKPDDRVRKSILNTCRLLEGRGADDTNNALPAIVTYAMIGPRPSDATKRYGGLLAAAGGTGRCCWDGNSKLNSCDASSSNVIDVCQHIRQPARSESQIRQDLQKGRYACQYREKQQADIGSMNWDQKPDIDCHLVGTNAGNPGANDACGTGSSLASATDILGEMACLQSVPKGRSFDDLEYRYCPDSVDDDDCEVLTRSHIRFVDPNESVFLVTDRAKCEAVKKGKGTVVRDPCPNAGDVCQTGDDGRCGFGRIRCIDEQEQCVAQFDAMPEICNGLDDDCDGKTDNIEDSWPKFNYTPEDLPSGYEEVECRQTNACFCPKGKSDSHVGDDFESYVKGWGGACYCEGF